MSHPTAAQLEAVAFGRLTGVEAREIRAHAANCRKCGSALRSDESVRRRLGLLRGGEPRIDVSGRVLEQVERLSQRRRLLRPARLAILAILAMALVAAGVLAAGHGHVRRAVSRLLAIKL